MKNKHFIYILFILILFSCKKSDFFNKKEKFTEQTKIISPFKEIEVRNRFEIELKSDTVDKIIIRADERFIDNINTEVSDSLLILSDKTKYNFARPGATPPKLIIHTRSLEYIYAYQPVSLTTSDTLKLESLLVRIYTDISDCNIIVKTNSFFLEVWGNGTGAYKISGQTTSLSMLMDGTPLVDASNLQADYAVINSFSTGDIYLNVLYYLEVSLKSTGNIFYSGNPTKIVEEKKSEGKLIKISK